MAKRKRLTPVPMGLEEEQAHDPLGRKAGESTNVTDLPLPRAPTARSRVPIASDAGAAASEAALAQMAEHLETAKSEGRLAIALPLDAIAEDHLTRDRIAIDEEEMAALIDSIAMRGQQTPIEVVALEDAGAEGRYGLISGWRRLAALRHLSEVTGEARFATVLAVLRQPSNAAEAYVAMVEENEIRANLSHYERARIVAQAVHQGVYPDTRRALRSLFGMASRSRRSKIGSFLVVVEALDDVLHFPTALPERLGLVLAKRLEEEPDLKEALRQALAAGFESAAAEQARLRDVLEHRSGPASSPGPAREANCAETSAGPSRIRIEESGDRLILSGAGLTPTLRADLRRWLENKLGA